MLGALSTHYYYRLALSPPSGPERSLSQRAPAYRHISFHKEGRNLFFMLSTRTVTSGQTSNKAADCPSTTVSVMKQMSVPVLFSKSVSKHLGSQSTSLNIHYVVTSFGQSYVAQSER